VKEKLHELYNEIIAYARQNFGEELDDAYDDFWEDEDPTDYFMGTVIDLAFVNFEDWMVCDYRPKEGKGIIDRYIEEKNPVGELKSMLEAMRDSVISLYEVTAVDGDTLTLRDLPRDNETTVPTGGIEGLTPGEVFAARVIEQNGQNALGRGIWPFGSQRKDQAMEFFKSHIDRVHRNRDANEDINTTLKTDAYVFNNIWISCLSLK
jgi:hypothetical protein